MKVCTEISHTRNIVKAWKEQGLVVGLVPTMGYLHEGHISLIKKAAAETDKVVVSIFVNPIQFGPNEDLDKYPRNFERDLEICEKAGASVVFHPDVSTMYGEDFLTTIDVLGVSEGLCGASRPGHFRGVCTVVNKLFHIIPADRAYFGEKDAQQLAVIRQMVKDLNLDITVVGCPIQREEDGLAMSSRNSYLTKEERKAATILHDTLVKAKETILYETKDPVKIVEFIEKEIGGEPLAKLDYVALVDSVTLKPITGAIKGNILVAVAACFGKTRLIDNFSMFVWSRE